MRLSLSIRGAGHHPGSWRHSGLSLDRLARADYYGGIAAAAEQAGFGLLYLDYPASAGQGIALEPFTLLSYLSAITSRIGIGAPAETAVSEPFGFARILAAIDHLSGGRAAWLPINRGYGEPARIRSGEAETTGAAETDGFVRSDGAVRTGRLEEFREVAGKLWDSWEPGALLVDKESGRFIDSAKVHLLQHQGEHFQVRGPLSIPRPPQGRPVMIGTVPGGASAEEAAASQADILFVTPRSLEESQAFYRELRQPDRPAVLLNLQPLLAPTEREARELAERLVASCASAELASAWEQNPSVFIGTPARLAEQLAAWFDSGAADGFNLQPALLPQGLELLAAETIPLLKAGGYVREPVSGLTLRDNWGFS